MAETTLLRNEWKIIFWGRKFYSKKKYYNNIHIIIITIWMTAKKFVSVTKTTNDFYILGFFHRDWLILGIWMKKGIGVTGGLCGWFFFLNYSGISQVCFWVFKKILPRFTIQFLIFSFLFCDWSSWIYHEKKIFEHSQNFQEKLHSKKKSWRKNTAHWEENKDPWMAKLTDAFFRTKQRT